MNLELWREGRSGVEDLRGFSELGMDEIDQLPWEHLRLIVCL